MNLIIDGNNDNTQKYDIVNALQLEANRCRVSRSGFISAQNCYFTISWR